MRRHVPELTLFYLLASIFYLIGCWIVTRDSSAPAPRPGRRLAWILGAAFVFRLTLLSLAPTLSEDLARYRWQGELQAAGGNPYLEVPEDPRWAALRDSTWPEVTRKDLPSVYGPLLELTYRATAGALEPLGLTSEQEVWAYKLPFAALELGVIAAVLLLLRANRLPLERVLIYCWSPLAIVEFWAQGHNDSMAALLVVLALAAARLDRWAAAFAALTLAALAKIWPVLLLPFLLVERQGRQLRIHWRPAFVALPLIVLVCWPYAGAALEAGKVLEGFGGDWRNNDSLFGLLYHGLDRDLEHTVDWVRWLWPAGLAAIWLLGFQRERAALAAIVWTLLLAANCFPWYLTWFLPLLALAPNAGLLLWTATVVLHYQVLTQYGVARIWTDSEFFRLLEYGPVLALLAFSAFRSGRNRILARRPQSTAPSTSRPSSA